MQFFIPPDFQLPVAWFADAALPGVIKQYQNIDAIIIDKSDRQMLRSLRKERLLFFTNHPSQAEPMIAYHVANVMGARFNYMATRRAFDFLFGAVGKLFQSVGAYSVTPGIADRDSMRMTRSIVANSGGKLVLFPEGEPMCGENDSLMPFQPGIIKLSFGALQDARKKDASADIIILPGFIKYKFEATEAEIREDLHKSIREIEIALGVDPGQRNLLRQFLMVGRLLLEQAEKEYAIEVKPDSDFDYRIGRVRHRMLDNIARRMELKNYNKESDAINKLRHLTSILELIEINYPMKDLPKLSAADMKWCQRECVKAYDMIVIKREYLVSRPTPERFYEWLARFESYVLGKTPRMLGGHPPQLPRNAYLSFATPFKLGQYYDDYSRDKSKTVEKVLGKLRQDMEKLLEDSHQLTYTLVDPGDVGGV
ncbi:MAG: 1-acyl-sn-glycerol-3-phosphate acyltransferase [Leptospiraceae bacterium]|nr:1-acyl-sn-glycerol-3-phosphate acyltransferase [Leptospiraceae bacterium]